MVKLRSGGISLLDVLEQNHAKGKMLLLEVVGRNALVPLSVLMTCFKGICLQK